MESLGERPVWSMSGGEKLSTLDHVHADIARLETYRLQLIAGLDEDGHAQDVGARDTVQLVEFRYRLNHSQALRDVRLARALKKYPAVSAALPTVQPADPAQPTGPTDPEQPTGPVQPADSADPAAGPAAGSEQPAPVVRLRPAQAEAIVSALEKVPSTVPAEDIEVAERELVRLARHLCPADLRTAAQTARDILDTDGPEPEEHKASARETLTLTAADRGVKFRGYLANENAELLRSLIHTGARPHKTPDGHPDPRPREKRQADALTTALTIAATATDTGHSHRPQHPTPNTTTAANTRTAPNASADADANTGAATNTTADADVSTAPATNATAAANATTDADADASNAADMKPSPATTEAQPAGAASDVQPAGAGGDVQPAGGWTDAQHAGAPSAEATSVGAAVGAETAGAATAGAGTAGAAAAGTGTAGTAAAGTAAAGTAAAGTAAAGTAAAGGASTAAVGGAAGWVPGFGAKANITVTIDWQDLKTATADALGDTVYGDGLSAATIRRLACDAKILPLVLGSNSEPLDVGRSERLVTRAMRRALNARDRGCVVCGAPPIMCDAHHLISWVDGGTKISNLVLLCRRHHTDLHAGHWTITITNGTVHVARPTWADVPHRAKQPGEPPPTTPPTTSTPTPSPRASACPNPGGPPPNAHPTPPHEPDATAPHEPGAEAPHQSSTATPHRPSATAPHQPDVAATAEGGEARSGMGSELPEAAGRVWRRSAIGREVLERFASGAGHADGATAASTLHEAAHLAIWGEPMASDMINRGTSTNTVDSGNDRGFDPWGELSTDGAAEEAEPIHDSLVLARQAEVGERSRQAGSG